MLELRNFDHVTHLQYNLSHDKIWVTWQNFVGDILEWNYDVFVITYISSYLYFKKVWSSQFCWHHQNYNHVD